MPTLAEKSGFARLLEASFAEWAAFFATLVLVAVAAWFVVRMRARFREDEGLEATSHRLLSQLGELQREGDITEEEYRSIKGRLIERLEGPSRPRDGGKR